MVSILRAIAAFIGPLLKPFLTWLAKESRRPREVKPAGADPDLLDDIDKQIGDSLLEDVDCLTDEEVSAIVKNIEENTGLKVVESGEVTIEVEDDNDED